MSQFFVVFNDLLEIWLEDAVIFGSLSLFPGISSFILKDDGCQIFILGHLGDGFGFFDGKLYLTLFIGTELILMSIKGIQRFYKFRIGHHAVFYIAQEGQGTASAFNGFLRSHGLSVIKQDSDGMVEGNGSLTGLSH